MWNLGFSGSTLGVRVSGLCRHWSLGSEPPTRTRALHPGTLKTLKPENKKSPESLGDAKLRS